MIGHLLDSDRFIPALLALVLGGALLLQWCEAAPALADHAWPEWTEEEKLDVARCMFAESESNPLDWAAVGWSLVKQWRHRPEGYPFARQVRGYCALFSKLSPRWYGTRPALIRVATWDSPPALLGAARRWSAIQAFVDRLAAGQVEDPCPRCLWWGGPAVDEIPPHWFCPLGPPLTDNVFCYVER